MANSRKSLPLNKSQTTVAITVYERALEAILARVVLSDGAAIAVACSGGLDSAVLLNLSADFCARRGHTLHVFHVHHGLSPNADQWLAHVQNECLRLNLSFDARKVHVTTIDQHGPENAARRARYEALADMCTTHRVELLLTAHHQDDQAETILLQSLRGSGLPGWSGMAEIHREHALLPATVTLARPLLACSRQQLEQIAQKRTIDHIVDESNEDARYKRNAIRHEIFPVIEKHFQGFTQALARSSSHFQTAQRLLDELAQRDLQSCQKEGELHLEPMTNLSSDRIDNLLRYWVYSITGSYPSQAQLYQLHHQMLHAANDTHPLLYIGQWTFQRERGCLVIRPNVVSNQPPTESLALVWKGEKHIEIPAWRGRLIFDDTDDEGCDPEVLTRGPLILRAREGGERLKLDVRRPSRSLKNLYQELGVAVSLRPWLPLLYAGNQLLFASGLGTSCTLPRSSPGIRLEWQSWGIDTTEG